MANTCIICLEPYAIVKPCDICNVIFHIRCLMLCIDKYHPATYKCVMCRHLSNNLYIKLATWINYILNFYIILMVYKWYRILTNKKNIIHITSLLMYLYYISNGLLRGLATLLNFPLVYKIVCFVAVIYIKHRHAFNYVFKAVFKSALQN
jgi:hypothetical protein